MVTVKKFSAVWCGPCRALAPVVNEIKGQFSNVKFEDYDVDTDFEAATQYGIRSVPTVVIERDGVEMKRFLGVQSKGALVEAISQHLS
jgi:thioredoxin 1